MGSRVIREDRDELIAILNRYLDEEISAFEFDEQLADLDERTEDETVCSAITSLCFFYDDITDHKVVAGKEAWDFFQRLLLLLKSDFVLEEQSRRQLL